MPRSPHDTPETPATVATMPVDGRASAPPGRQLLVLADGIAGVYALPAQGRLVLGRSSQSDFRVNHVSVSRQHVALDLAATKIQVRDLGSANGTFVRGVRLLPEIATDVTLGEPFEIGTVTLVVQDPTAGAVRFGGPGSSTHEPAPAANTDEVRVSSGPVIVQDAAMARLYTMLRRVAAGAINVLLLGETGVGKDVAAEVLHRASPRAGRPYVQLNCAALAPTLLEAELFGYEKGAYTGAAGAKQGLLEAAAGGTVFLDEVGEMPLPLQAKLLRVLEDRKVLRVGGLQPRPIDVRFVAATNRDLRDEIAAGTFRQDLYFRLHGVAIHIPPLRERPNEIVPLARAFALRAARELGQGGDPAFDRAVLARFAHYGWPGNVRELRNVVERAVLLAGGSVITEEHLPTEIMVPEAPRVSRPPPVPSVVETTAARPSVLPPEARRSAENLREELEALERERIVSALEQCAGNQTRAAEMLGMPRRTLVKRLQSYAIPRPRKRDDD